ncbi:MAG TPA: (Fe-S)-binding protein, partial [Candidatus Wallbacteria bacterium]|nr:(Fe-S)-binding protein [Candidatus Wallbacteria bacterium]
ISAKDNIFDRRFVVIDFASSTPGRRTKTQLLPEMFATSYKKDVIFTGPPASEEEITKVLQKTGKLSPEDHLNCGACGYNSCRDKAIAVISGMAELEMCIPYMKMLAERRTDRIIETSPNGIIILDDRLNIISMNAAFKKMFLTSEAVIGKRISYLIDPTNFEKLSTGAESKIETVEKYLSYNLTCHEILYLMPAERQFVGIFINITNLEDTTKKLENIKSRTVEQAKELLAHQINMAQQMAKFLGEMTAHGEDLVRNLIKISDTEKEK